MLPKIKKVFDTTGPKKAAAAEATKSFDESKVYVVSISSKLYSIKTIFFLYVINDIWKYFLLNLSVLYNFQEEYSKEFEEKKADLQPKVVEIYEASSTEIKVHIISQTICL